MKYEMIDINLLKEYENNAKIHTQKQIDQIIKSICDYGNNDPIGIDENNMILEGHGRYLALKQLGHKEVPVFRISHLSEQQKREYILVHNKINLNTGFDLEMLDIELEDLDLSFYDFELEVEEVEEEPKSIFDKIKENPIDCNLFDTFLIPPFSILDTRQKYWIDRKRQWKDLGIKSEVGRGENLTFAKSLSTPSLTGTSIFDPVLCEISYEWFTPQKNSIIIDPFAGGSVRGVVAERKGFRYIGCDLRKEQIEANIQNAKEIGCNLDAIKWINDNSVNLDNHVENESCDLMFTCPPYFDLEVYSDNPEDISNMNWEDFSRDYEIIIQKAVSKLKNNRFAIVVICNVRDNNGIYLDLTGLTKEVMKKNNLSLYNEIILLNNAGTAAMRARSYMVNRKVVRVHQEVLVFYKGNPKEIKKEFPKTIDFDVELCYPIDNKDNER